MTDIQRGFRDVDRQVETASFGSYLETMSAALAVEKARTLDLLQPVAGQRLLDVGCGQGTDARHLSAAVGPGGQVVGLDLSRSLLGEAQRANARQPSLGFAVADAHEMPFADSAFDGARTERVLQHVEEPSRVLSEMCRVVRAGGRIVTSEPDWGSLVLDSSDPAAAGEVCDAIWRDRIPNPGIGRELVRRLVDVNATIVEVIPTTVVLRSLDLASEMLSLPHVASAELLEEFRDRDARGRFFAAITGFTVVARAPSSDASQVAG
jgi:SAM-dependent methyltransferase